MSIAVYAFAIIAELISLHAGWSSTQFWVRFLWRHDGSNGRPQRLAMEKLGAEWRQRFVTSNNFVTKGLRPHTGMRQKKFVTPKVRGINGLWRQYCWTSEMCEVKRTERNVNSLRLHIFMKWERQKFVTSMDYGFNIAHAQFSTRLVRLISSISDCSA